MAVERHTWLDSRRPGSATPRARGGRLRFGCIVVSLLVGVVRRYEGRATGSAVSCTPRLRNVTSACPRRTGIRGVHGFYTVKPGQAYSQVLGNSTLDVKNFLGLQLAAPAGTPNTPSNP